MTTDHADPRNTPPHPTASLTRCAFHLAVVKALLGIIGFGPTLRLVLRARQTAETASTAQLATAATIADRIATAAAFFPGRARCLEQSLVLLYQLGRQGIAARLRLGVQTFGHRAHAWVECAGQPVGEPTELIAKLTVFPDTGL